MPANLTPRQRRAIEVLITSGRVDLAAKAANCSRQTVYDWMKREEFKAALYAAEAEALDSLSRELVALGSKATMTLQGAMDDEAATLSARVSAARVVLDNILRIRELNDLEKRVKALEERQQNDRETD